MIEIESVAWERIQVVIRLRTDAGTDPACLDGMHLVPLDRRGGAVSPSRVVVDGLTARAWFNVMAGPGAMPLESGRWALMTSPPDPVPVLVAEGVAIDLAVASRHFPLASGAIDVIASLEPGTRALSFRVDHVTTRPKGVTKRARAAVRSVARPIRRVPGTLCIAVARRTVRRSGRRVLFTSGSSSMLGGNLKAVHDRMVERGLDRDYELVRTFGVRPRTRTGARKPLSLPALWRLTRIVASSDVIFVLGSLHEWSDVIAPSRGTRYIQLWHAVGAFKTMGYSRVGKDRALSPYSRLHKNYTSVVVSSEHVRPYYAEAFGVPIERVVATGVPRTDAFFDPELRAAGLAAARRGFPMTDGRMTILFAPTFRDPAHDGTYDYARIDFHAMHALAVERDAIVLFRMHPFVRDPVPIPEALRDRLVDATHTSVYVNDLLLIVDLLITDYSSIITEFSTLGRPMLFFAYDLDEYIASRDFYEPFEEYVPGRIVRTFDDLLDAIRRDDYEIEKVPPFASRQFSYQDGRSTDRVIDELVLAR